jgi:hypothetical protein
MRAGPEGSARPSHVWPAVRKTPIARRSCPRLLGQPLGLGLGRRLLPQAAVRSLGVVAAPPRFMHRLGFCQARGGDPVARVRHRVLDLRGVRGPRRRGELRLRVVFVTDGVVVALDLGLSDERSRRRGGSALFGG